MRRFPGRRLGRFRIQPARPDDWRSGVHRDLECGYVLAGSEDGVPRRVHSGATARGTADRSARLGAGGGLDRDRKSTRLNSSHLVISDAVFCLKKKKNLAPPTLRLT